KRVPPGVDSAHRLQCTATSTFTSRRDSGARASPPSTLRRRPPHHLESSVPGVFVAGDVRAESAKRVAAAAPASSR
ncbi:hypothetical protein C6A85_72110, partial [Mycobacterium sp. ITM-2017-0098]